MLSNTITETSDVPAILFSDQNDTDRSLGVEEEASFESVLEELGSFGKFQLTQYTLLCLSMGITTALIFSYVFIGYAPPHICNKVNETQLLTALQLQNDSTAFVTYHSCELVVFTNLSGTEEKITDVSCPSGRNFSTKKYISIVSEWDMVCESAGIPELVATLFAVGNIVGGMVAAIICNRLGRKNVSVCCSVILFIVEVGIIFAPNVFVIAVLRFFSGIFHEGLNVAGIVLATEIRTPGERTILGIVECVIWIFCTLLVGALAYGTQHYGWRGFQIATALLGLFFPLPLLFLKESPRWLTLNGKIEDALKVLRVASKQNKKDFAPIRAKYLDYVSKERKIKREDVHRKHVPAAKETCKELFCHRNIIIITLISSFAWLTHELTYYGMYMMSSTLSGDRFLNFSLMALTEIPSNLVLFAMMPRMGRRKIIAIFLSIASVSLLVCSFMESFASETSSYGTLSIVLFLIGKLAITSSFNVVYIYTPEIFPTNIRTIGFAVCYSIGKIGSLLAPYIRPFYTVVTWGPAVIFCAMSFFTLLVTPMLPEMRGVNLSDTTHYRMNLKTKKRHETDCETRKS